MTPQALLNTLVVEGFRLTSDGESLELTGPPQRLTSELKQSIRDNKEGLLQLLPVSYESAERYAIQRESTAPPEGDDWPEELTWSKVREAVATGQPPKGWEFVEQPCQCPPEPKSRIGIEYGDAVSELPYNEQDASGRSPRDASDR